MNLRDIRRFRSNLRRFERLNTFQAKSCCGSVTFAQCLVLLEIEETGRSSMADLVSRLRLDKSTLSRTVNGLVKDGLVKRLRDNQDRRVIPLQLTGKGKTVCRSINKSNDAYFRRIFDRIPAAQRAKVVRNFEILVQASLDCEAETV